MWTNTWKLRMTSYDISCTLASLASFGIGTFKPVIFCAVLTCARLGPKGYYFFYIYLLHVPLQCNTTCTLSDLLF
jgi:hypothetical protein